MIMNNWMAKKYENAHPLNLNAVNFLFCILINPHVNCQTELLVESRGRAWLRTENKSKQL